MEIILVISIFTSVSVSFLCSLMESAFYAVPMTYVHEAAKSVSITGKLLFKFKEDMGTPIAAILILNTIANTLGASASGFAVGAIFGAKALLPFSIFLPIKVSPVM